MAVYVITRARVSGQSFHIVEQMFDRGKGPFRFGDGIFCIVEHIAPLIRVGGVMLLVKLGAHEKKIMLLRVWNPLSAITLGIAGYAMHDENDRRAGRQCLWTVEPNSNWFVCIAFLIDELEIAQTIGHLETSCVGLSK